MEVRWIIQFLGILSLSYGGLFDDFFFLFGGMAALIITYSNDIKKNAENIKKLNEKLNIKEELNKIKREIDMLKMGKKGGWEGFDPVTLWVIVIIILFVIWLVKKKYGG